MLTDYINKVMKYAQFERLEDGTIFGSIAPELPGFQGVWSDSATEAASEQELRDVLESWILLNISDHTPLPVVDGLKIEVGRSA